MKKLYILIILCIVFSISFTGTILLRPEIAIGKEVNGNHCLEIIPMRISWNPIPEWFIKAGYSVNYTNDRRISGRWNHFSSGLIAKVEYKPIKFLEELIKINTLSDFTISFEKSFSDRYSEYTNPVSYVPQTSYERIGIGFNIEI